MGQDTPVVPASTPPFLQLLRKIGWILTTLATFIGFKGKKKDSDQPTDQDN